MKFETALTTEKIRNIMSPRGIKARREATYGEVIQQLQAEEKFCAVIVDGPKVIGIFTEMDALKRGLQQNKPANTPIEKIMTPNPTLIDVDDTLAVAIRRMHEGGYRHLPVVNSEREYVGLASVRDIILYLSENYPDDVYNLPPDPNKYSEQAEGA